MTLNGWQRLWVVASVLCLVGVCLLAYVAWPTATPISDFAVTTSLGRTCVITKRVDTGSSYTYEVVAGAHRVEIHRDARLSLASRGDVDAAVREAFGKIVAETAPAGLSRKQFDALVDLTLKPIEPTNVASAVRSVFPGAYDDLNDMQLSQAFLAKYPFLDIGDHPPVINVPLLGLVQFPVTMSADAINRTASGLAAQELRRRRLATFGKAFSAWVLSIVVLYAAGWTVGWIRRGFAHPH